MGFSVQLPVPGQPFSTEGVKVGNDIQTIAQWGNGHILGTDLDPAAGILPAQLDVSAQAPVGVVFTFAGRSAIPTGYALCDGRTLNRSDFPRGFDFATAEVAAGNPLWTVNAGAATFTVPNLSSRFVYSGALASIGQTAGEASHTLNIGELPVHNHGGVTGNVGSGPIPVPSPLPNWQYSLYGAAGYEAASNNARNDHNHSIPNQGSGTAHNNMPPYVVLALIVKV